MSGVDRQDEQDHVVRDNDDELLPRHRLSPVLWSVLVSALIAGPVLVSMWGRPAIVAALIPALVCWIVLFRQGAAAISNWLVVSFILVRFLMLGFEPALSDDIWRYVRDGAVLRSAANPYVNAPVDDSDSISAISGHDRINHPELRSIYPPYAQVLFMISGLLGGAFGWRLLVLTADLAIFRLLWRTSRQSAMRWLSCPVVIWEGAWNGHIDIVAALTLLLAVGVGRSRFVRAVWLGLGVGLKVTPGAAALSLARGWRLAPVLLIVTAVTFAGFIPFLGGPIMPGMADFAERWSFNSPLYEVALAGTELTGIDSTLREILSSRKDQIGMSQTLSDRFYSKFYPEAIARGILAGILVILLIAIYRTRRLVTVAERGAWSVAALILLSPTIHPWYWLVVLPAALSVGSLPLVALATFAPFSYLLYGSTPQWVVTLLCYGPFLVLTRISLRFSESESSVV